MAQRTGHRAARRRAHVGDDARRPGGAHRAKSNLVPPEAFREILDAYGMTVAEAAAAMDRSPARIRELTRRYGGSPKSFEQFVVALRAARARES